MIKSLIVFVLLITSFGSVAAKQISVPMLFSEDIQKAVNPNVFQGVSGDSAGAVYFPDEALAVKIENAEGDSGNVISQWSKSHSFYLIPFTISILPSEDRIAESVSIVSVFGSLGRLNKQPIIIDIFPKTSFEKGDFSTEGEVKIGGGLELEPVPVVVKGVGAASKADVDANAAFKFKYAPAYANIISGFASANSFWRFTRTQENYPVGDIPIKLLVALPNTFKSKKILLKFDVTAKFSGSWWDKGKVFSNFITTVNLP